MIAGNEPLTPVTQSFGLSDDESPPRPKKPVVHKAKGSKPEATQTSNAGTSPLDNSTPATEGSFRVFCNDNITTFRLNDTSCTLVFEAMPSDVLAYDWYQSRWWFKKFTPVDEEDSKWWLASGDTLTTVTSSVFIDEIGIKCNLRLVRPA